MAIFERSSKTPPMTPQEVFEDAEYQYFTSGGQGINQGPIEMSTLYADARRKLYEYAPGGQNIWRSEIEYLKPLFADGPKSVLDVGSGNGRFLLDLEEATSNSGPMLGIDTQEGHINTAIELIRADGKVGKTHVEFMQADANNPPFQPRTFDIVTMNFLVYHLPEPGRVIVNGIRLLKPGGTLLVASRDPSNQAKVLEHARLAASEINKQNPELSVRAPESVYRHCDIATTGRLLKSMIYPGGKRALFVHPQTSKMRHDGPLEIPLDKERPGDEEGWRDWREAVMSMRPYMRLKGGGRVVGGELLGHVVDDVIKKRFIDEYQHRLKTEGRGYVRDWASQAFMVATKIPERETKKDAVRRHLKSVRVVTSSALKEL